MPADQSKLYKGKVLWLLTGIFFVALGLTFMVVAFRRSRRSLWVVANTSPIEMLLTLEINEDSDSTTYRAQLRDLHSAKARWRAWVDPTFKARSLVGLEVPAQVSSTRYPAHPQPLRLNRACCGPIHMHPVNHRIGQ